MFLRMAAAGLVAICGSVESSAASRRKTSLAGGSKPPSVLNLENKRSVSLLKFEILLPDAKSTEQEHIVGALRAPLAGGQSGKVKLSGVKGCVFEVRWKFEDLADSGSVDLCNDARIVLVE